jgi:ankyrin repeat protein
MASSIFCNAPKDNTLDSTTLARQNSGVGDAYSVGPKPSGSNDPESQETDESEMDYDTGGTELYRAVEARDWDTAIARLESHPAEAKIWVSRKEYNSDKIRWRLLPLHATCIFRSPLALIEALVDVYPEAAQRKDDQGMMPIHLACRNGASKGVVLTLLNSYPASLGEKDRKGRNPLDLVESSNSQNIEVVSEAIRSFRKENSGAVAPKVAEETKEVDYENRTVLFRLLMKKDWEAAIARAESFPEEAATWIATKGFNGALRFLPLHKACVLQPPDEVIEALITAYPDGAQSRDQDGWLPIHCGCFYGADASTIKVLLGSYAKGAQLKDDEGRLPLHYACLKGASQEIVDVLLENFSKGAMSKDDEGRLPIHHACSKGAPEGVIDALLKASPKGAQAKDDQGRLPLHHACRKSSSERIVRTLLRVYPRAAQIKDDQDKLPVHYACQHGVNSTIVNILLTTYPESINVKNGFGYTPLAEARAIDNPKMEPIIHVLEKFKVEQDKIKIDSGENAIVEAKLDALTRRVMHLEKLIGNAMDMGAEIKGSVKKAKDPYILIDRMADRLANLDVTEEQEPIATKSKGRYLSRGRARS